MSRSRKKYIAKINIKKKFGETTDAAVIKFKAACNSRAKYASSEARFYKEAIVIVSEKN